MATEILAQHLTICTAARANIRGKFSSVRNIKQKRTKAFPICDKEKKHALYRWAFTKMNERFHKCERNKVRPIQTSKSMFSQLLTKHLHTPALFCRNPSHGKRMTYRP